MSSQFLASLLRQIMSAAFVGLLLASPSTQAAIASDVRTPVLDSLLAIESDHASLCSSRLDEDSVRRQVQELVGLASKEMGSEARGPGAPEDASTTAVRVLNGIVFGHAGIRPSQDLHDPCNVFLSSALARKQGYCVGIVSLYLVLVEQLELPVAAVSTPSHVFLRYDDGVTRINIETMNAGAAVSDEQYIAQQRIAESSVRKGVFLRHLSPQQFLAQVHNNLGVIYSERKQYEAAEAEYALALSLDRRLSAAWYNRGKQYLEMADFAPAIHDFTKALRRHPNDTWALNNRGLAYRGLKDEQRARADFEAVLRIDPAFEPAKKGLKGTPAEVGPGGP
jgi:regulator of sirC expression with transglutaminase-like and TPR domain